MALSQKQLTFYYEVSARKGIAPKDTTSMTPFQLSQEIEHILTLPNRASENQLDMLRNLLQELVNAGVPGVKLPPQKFYDGLNFDTASTWIQNAQNIRAKHFHILPANEMQIERLAKMYLFPEVEWESVTKQTSEMVETFVAPADGGESQLTQKKVTYTEETVIQRKIYMDEERDGQRLWRYMDEEEFKSELKKLTHQQASNLIDKYAGSFEAWSRTRITRGQKTQIRQLENRMASIFTPKEVTAFDLDQPFELELGDTNVEIESDSPFQVKSKKLDNWNPTAYEGLKEQQLDMMSREEADIYIRQLRKELQDKELRNVGGAQSLDYADYGIEEARTAKNEADARTKEFKELNNFLYGLADIVGLHFEMVETVEIDGRNVEMVTTPESLRHDALQIFFHHPAKGGAEGGASTERKQMLKNNIIDFIKLAVQRKSIKFDGIMALADRSEIASEILDEMILDKDFAVELLKLQRNQY